jgi:hypothetical protein
VGAVPVRAQIELILYTFEGNGRLFELKDLSKLLFGRVLGLATLILAPKGAMVMRFPGAELWWGMRISIIKNG